MSSLSWSLLVNYFMRFRKEADKIGFYTSELDKMEQSLFDIRPAPLELKDVMNRGEDRDAKNIRHQSMAEEWNSSIG